MHEAIKNRPRPYDRCDVSEPSKASAWPIAIWAVLLFVASVYLTFLNSAQQLERHRILKNELDGLRQKISQENIEANEIRTKAEQLADTLKKMGWVPPEVKK